MKLPKYIQTALFIILLSVSAVWAQDLYPEYDSSVEISAAITEDTYSTLYVIPDEVEVREPSWVTVTMLNSSLQSIPGRYIELVAPGLTFTQPSQPSNQHGVVVVEVFGTAPGSYNICARDITLDGLVIDILDCDTLYVVPVTVPSLLSEPHYTKGTTNSLFWNSLGSEYEYSIEVSTDSNFYTVKESSGWISGTMFTFEDLVNEKMYFYRVRARNNHGGTSGWSNVEFSVQDNEAPEISIISIGNAGENIVTDWESNYEVEIVYRVEDNLSLENANFYCVREDGKKEQCGSTSNNGVIYTTTITLSELERDENNNLLTDYSFCVVANDAAGNISESCGITLEIPTGTEEEEQEDEQEEEPEEETPTKVGDIVKDIVKETETSMEYFFGNLDDYRLQDLTTSSSIATIAVGFGTLIGGLIYLPIYLFQLILSILSLLGLRKKKEALGYVYDSSTKEPLSQAIVRVYNENGTLIWTDVTNSKGLFGLALEDGKYTIKVAARGYEFPSKLIFGKTDYPLENVYHGEEFTIENQVSPEFSIPVDELEMGWLKRVFVSLLSLVRSFSKAFSIFIFSFGLLISIYSYSKNPNWFTLILILLYIPSFVVIVAGIFKKKLKYGVVKDQKGKPVRGLSVGLKDLEYERTAAKRITDGKGQYRFVVNKGEYELEILDKGYEILEVEEKEHEVLSDGSLLIALDIVVKPTEVEN